MHPLEWFARRLARTFIDSVMILTVAAVLYVCADLAFYGHVNW